MCREMTGQLLHYANTGSTAHHAHTWYYVTNTRDRDAMNYDVYHAYSLQNGLFTVIIYNIWY